MKPLKKIDEYIAAVEKTLIVGLFSALILSIVLNIVSRNLFKVSYPKLLELGPSFVLWLALLGSTLALKHQRHIKLEILLRFCSPGFQRTARIAVNVFGAAVMGVLGWAAIVFVQNEIAIFGSRGWLAVIFPVFFTLGLFRYVSRMIYILGDRACSPS